VSQKNIIFAKLPISKNSHIYGPIQGAVTTFHTIKGSLIIIYYLTAIFSSYNRLTS